jgi:spore coat polysaccharide biosynthesis protein SpsF
MELMSKRTLVILQARMSSNRLPGKVMKEINGFPMIYWQIQRILRSKAVDDLIVATSADVTDDVLAGYLKGISVKVFRGSLNDVLSRYLQASLAYPHSALIRLTGDCPLVMPDLIDQMVKKFYELDVDYLSNTLKPTYPDGLDIEIIKSGVLNRLVTFSLNQKEIEHVTFGIYTRPEIFKCMNYENFRDCSSQRWTVDYQEDFDFVKKIFSRFQGQESEFTYEDLNEYLDLNPGIESANSNFKRNEGLRNDEYHG